MNMDQVEEISEEEWKLAGQLRQLCTAFGEERQNKLHDSADVLMKLGGVYAIKSAETSGMLRKLSFIKSCALLHGAKVRFRALYETDQVERVDEALMKLGKELYNWCGIAENEENLLQISQGIAENVRKMREESKTDWARISKIANDDRKTEEAIIQQVRDLCRKTTENYEHVMRKVTERCLRLLGEPRCKFCQVGLGSIARREITVYSDFEHVIVLEEGVQHLQCYPNVLEYFRWFAVVFQAIIIGLGETFVRSVGVKSINDLYNMDRTKNWFYDVVTPSGIAFDGMVPHSCMNPLGRQSTTKKKNHKVELIQPASKMANYLTSDENVKNGYYMKDILTRTCLVYGDQAVYESFLNFSRQIIEMEQMLSLSKEQSRKINENVNAYIRGGRIELHSEKFDPKVTFYRPITALLSYLARFFGISACSSFDIIEKVESVGGIDATLSHRFKYAVAVACRVRMNAYFASGHQRYKITDKPVLELLGRKDAWGCYRFIQYLYIVTTLITQEMDKEQPFLPRVLKFNHDFFAENVTEDVFELLELGKFEEAIKLGEENLDAMENRNDFLKMRWLLVQCHLLLGKRDTERKSEHWMKVEELCNVLISAEDCPPPPKSDCYDYLAEVLRHRREYAGGIQACTNWLHIHRTDAAVNMDNGINYPKILNWEVEMRLETMDLIDLLIHLEERLRQESDWEGEIILRYAIAQTQLRLGRLKEAKNTLSQVISQFTLHARELMKVLRWVKMVAEQQCERGWLEDSLVSINLLLEDPSLQSDSNEMVELDRLKLDTLSKLHRCKDAAKHLDTMTEVSKEASRELILLLREKLGAM